jgi:ectoine hydroxylase-related dioxygenase (phytanoyl-CoA dioxygenase family)
MHKRCLSGLPIISAEEVEAYQRDGAVLIRGVFREWMDIAAAGIERNLEHPGEYASENDVEEGRFFDDYCNWPRIPEFGQLVNESPAAELAARAMQSKTSQFFHDHVLVKEPHTPKPTPWHADMPYYFLDGEQTVSMWLPMEPVEKSTLRFIAGSHKWPNMVRPVSWADDSDFYDQATHTDPTQQSGGQGTLEWSDVPDPDREANETGDRVLEWSMEPGDVVLFHFRTAHAARGNLTDKRRRALSLRWMGDDVRYLERPGRTSPPYPGHEMATGEKLRADWFPVVWQS